VPKTGPKKKLYNLTLHSQTELAYAISHKGWDVEESPRLTAIKDPQNWFEIKSAVRKAITGIPKGSHVLIGGMTQISILIRELNMFNLYYVNLDYSGSRTIPVGVSAHEGWNREEKYELEN